MKIHASGKENLVITKEKAQNFINRGKIIDKKLIVKYVIGVCITFLLSFLALAILHYYILLTISLLICASYIVISIKLIKNCSLCFSNFFLVYFISSICILIFCDLSLYFVLTTKMIYSPILLISMFSLQIIAFFLYILLLQRLARESSKMYRATPYVFSVINMLLFLLVKFLVKDLADEQVISLLSPVVFAGTILALYDSAIIGLKFYYSRKYKLTSFDLDPS